MSCYWKIKEGDQEWGGWGTVGRNRRVSKLQCPWTCPLLLSFTYSWITFRVLMAGAASLKKQLSEKIILYPPNTKSRLLSLKVYLFFSNFGVRCWRRVQFLRSDLLGFSLALTLQHMTLGDSLTFLYPGFLVTKTGTIILPSSLSGWED